MGVRRGRGEGGQLADAIDQTAVARQISERFGQAVGGAQQLDGSLSVPRLHPHIRRLFDAYGPQRCYWGTDITNGFAKATYSQRITHFTEELTFLSEEDKDWIMGRAILARLGWT